MDQYVGEHFDKVSNLAGSLQTKRMEGFKAMHATAMDPEVNPLDGSLLPLSPPLAYIQKKILPRIFRNPLARCCKRTRLTIRHSFYSNMSL